jgi:hypothetical protein
MTKRLALAMSFTASAALIATATLAQPALEGGKKLTTTMTGAAEVPPADLDGTGTATITINPGQQRICWEITTANLDPVVAAHIHSAHAGQNGPIVVPLTATNGTSTGCADVARSLADAIRKAPQGYYVNVHTTIFPGGAIRGQLS